MILLSTLNSFSRNRYDDLEARPPRTAQLFRKMRSAYHKMEWLAIAHVHNPCFLRFSRLKCVQLLHSRIGSLDCSLYPTRVHRNEPLSKPQLLYSQADFDQLEMFQMVVGSHLRFIMENETMIIRRSVAP